MDLLFHRQVQPIKVNGEHTNYFTRIWESKSTILILKVLWGIQRKREENNKDLLRLVDVFVFGYSAVCATENSKFTTGMTLDFKAVNT